MAVYKIYHKDGSILSDANGKEIEVHSIEYNGTWMGECFVTVTFENEAPISFSIGDYIEYRGERFEINYDPGKIKCASKDSYGGAFKYDSVKFNALSDELVRCDMLDLVLYDNKLHYTALPQFAFYVESLDDLLDRIQANLDELYGKASWKLYSRNKQRSIQRGGLESEWNSVYGEGTADNVIDSTSISISDQTCWDALSLVNSQFDVNFIIRNRNVYVGTAGMPTSNIFKYGKDKGLYEIEQNSESDQAIVTRLRAYGSNKNLPNHYYADLGSVPFLNITGDYHEGSTENGLSVMMEDSTYAGMFTDIISDNGTIKHCSIRGSIDGYEFDGTLELVKKNVTKSTTRLLAEGKEVSDAIKAKIDAGIVEVDFVRGANKAKFDGNRINYVSNLPNNMACDRLMLPGFPNKSLKEWWDAQSAEKKVWLNPSGKEHIFSNDIYRPYVDSLNIEKIGVRPSSVFFDQDDKVNGIVEIYPTIEEMEVDGVRIDEIYTGTNVEDDGRFGDDVSDIANVAIYLSPKINFDIRGLMQDDFTIHMKDGMCAGREFKVAGCTKQNDGSWKLMIERKPDDSLNLYFPYNDFQIKKGDHFVLSGIELPDAYIEAASEKLLRYCIAYLDKNDYTRYVYQPKVDEIFMARQHDTAMADASGLTKSLYLTLKEGDIMLFKDDDLGIDAEITIDQLTIKEEDGKIPTYEITLREEKEVGTIQKIQNQISSITNGNGGSFTGGTGGGGLSSSQIKNLIDAIGSDRFLSKLNPDTAAGIITFLQGTNWGNFTSESGAAMSVDPTTGQTYMEVDRLKVRLKAFFEKLEVQKVGYVGGKLIVTKGQGVDILDVENIYDSEGNVSAYRCYFLGEQEGRKIDNLLAVNDQMMCKDFNISKGSTDGATNKYYWRLATAVSTDVVKRGNNVCHWVDLSATDCDTNSDIPEIGDTICHLGNREDTDRQGAEILSVVDANSPSFTIYSGINNYSLVNKEYIDMGVVNGKAYCNIYGSTYIGDRERKSGYLRWNDDKKTFEIKGTIDITSPLSSGGTIGGAIDDAANAYKGEFDAFTSNVNEVIGGFQAQIDGVIETWFYDPKPTLGNLPASEWKDNTTKDKHLGDLYYSKSGLAYRFQKEGDIYKWVQINDTAITSALKEAKAAKEAAAAAQGTADTAQTTAESKMKVFVQTPTNSDEYSVGDMWVNATYPADGSTYSNEILKCKEGKAAGAEFKIDHWEKASKYTDDTAAKAAQKTANDAATAAQKINDSINDIDGNLDVALKDKIITKTEAAAIKEALKGLDAIMADVNKTKEELVNNAVYKSIASDVQTDYDTAYTNLVAAYNELSEYINDTLLVANPITDEILSTYTTKYSNFKTKYEDYVSKLTVVRNSMDALLNTRIGDIATMLGGLKATTDAMNESTQISGGLILSSLLALGYTNNSIFNVMSGVSGLYESGETGGGIAFWAGGHRIDINNCTKNADGTYSIGGKVVNPADFLVRHDGTGYAAGGKMWWDEDGKIHADPQSFLINEEYVGNVMQLFQFEYSGGTEFTNIVHAIPQKPFESLSVGANGLTLYNGDKSAKFYIKDGALFLEGDLAVTGGITMYATDGVTSGLLDQVYAILDSSKFEIKNGVITIKGDIGGGTVKGATLGGVAVTLNANGILEFDAYPTTLPASDVYAWAKAATKPTYSWGEITEKPTSFTPSAHTHDDRYYTESEIDTKLGSKLDTSLKGAADGLATLDSSGKVPSSQLPSYVDDVLEYDNKASFPNTGESGKIYIDKETNLTYRWGGTAYVEISQSLALGETSSTAYAGDKGKKNADNIAALQTGKADKATTLSGYGITDAYAKMEVNTKLTDGSVTKIGTKDVGSATLPIYLKAGVPTACNTTLGVSITGNSATATKLANARTLWGQSFDGSENVSGNMTGVGTITPTGEDLKVVGNLIVTGGIVMYADDGATIESGFAALLAAHIDGVTIKYNEAQQKIYSVMTGIKVNGTTYKPSETDGYITIPDYPTSLDWENIENKPSSFTPASHTHTFASLTSKPTTLSGYGITDAKIANGVITLGTSTITPLTVHQTVTLASGTNNGTLKLTVGSKTTDNIAVKGLGSAAYTASSDYAAASHTHSQYLVASSLDGYVNALTDNTSTNVFVTAIAKNGKTLSYTKSFTKKSLTSASHSGWSSVDTDKLIIPDMSFIAYWNGAYNSSGSSNLAYCNKGAFGDMATASKSSYYTKTDTYSKTEVNTKLTDGSVTKLGTATVGGGTQHFYLNEGTATASTSTVGGTAKPIFLNSGTLTAISATVGSVSRPVYLNGGSVTACNYDFTSYLPLAGGTMTAGARISHGNGNLYLGNSDNNGWVMCQDICSQNASGDSYWSLRTDGRFHSKVAVVSGNTSVGSLTINGINVTKSSDGILKIDGNLIVTGGITMYATDGVASGLMEQILVDGTTIGKKADGTLYAINTGNVRSIIMGSTTYTPNDSGAVTLPEKVTWANIEGKPSSFTPSSHTHAISQITNLQATLDGKAAASHTHSYLPLSGGTMTGTIKYGGANREIIRTGGDDTGWRGGLKYSWSGNTTIALWGKHTNSQFVWNAGNDFSSNDVNGTATRTYDFQVGRVNGILEALIGGNKIWHAGNDGSGSGLDADTVDGYHASSLVKFYLSPMTNDAPADSAKSWFTNTMPSASGAIVYNVPGSEKTIIAGKSSGAYGHMLQLNYGDTYLRILRYYNGSWKSTDWEKISAGYADSSGNASSATKLTSSAGSATLPIYFSDGKPVACTASSVFSNLSNSGNNISVTVAGQNRTLTVGYADTVDGYHASNIMQAGWIGLYRTGGSASTIKWTRIGRFITTASDNPNNDAMIEFFSNGDQNYTYFGHGRLMLSSYGTGSSNMMLTSVSDGSIHFYATIDANRYIWLGHNAWWTGSSKYRVLFTGSFVEWYSSSLTVQTTNPNDNYITDNGTFKYNAAMSTASSGSSHSWVWQYNSRVAYATSAGNSDTCDGLHVHSGRNNEANKIVRTDGSGYIQCGYINSSNGHEKNASSPTYVWGSNSSDSYLRSYQTSKLAVYTASKWATARKITLTGSVTGSVSIDGSGDVTLATTTNHTHSYLPLAGGTMTGQIQRAGQGSSWIKGRDNAMIRVNSKSGYSVLSSIKTTNGSWEIGHYDASGYYNNLLFGYYTDDAYSSDDNNGRTKITFTSGGHITATQFNGALNGNAATASKWATARTITLSGSVTGSVSIDGSGNVTLATTTNHTHSYLPLSGGTMSNTNVVTNLNADLLDGEHSSAFAHRGAHNNLIASGNEFTFASSGFTGEVFINYRTAGGLNGNISKYTLFNGAGHSLGTIIHTGNYSSYALPLSGGTMTNGARISHADGNLYLGRADNNGWIMCQDMCSQTASGDGYWSLRTNGTFHALTTYIGGHLWLNAQNASSSTSGASQLIFGNNGTQHVVITSNTGAVIVNPSTSSYTGQLVLRVGTSSTSEFAGNIKAGGGITMYSDLRKKNILSDEVLSVKEIAAAPLFRHTYKSDDNQYIHVGTSAQYWSGIHEDWFTRKDSEGYYQMELQNLGVAMGISLAREIVKYESKTDKKIRLMRKRINELEARVKELEERRTA